MTRKYGLISASALWLMATGAFAADTPTAVPPPPAAPAAYAAAPDQTKSPAGSGIKIQFGTPADLTLKEARKQAHENADKVDKITPEQWAEGQKKFHEEMAKISKMTPEEKKKAFPGVPQQVLAHLGSLKEGAGGMPADTPAVALEKARKFAHAYVDKLDKMSEKEWDDRQKSQKEAREFLENYNKMTPKERQALAMKQMQKHLQDKKQASPDKPASKSITGKAAETTPQKSP